MPLNDELNSLKIQFYAVSGVLAFFVIVLVVVVINLFVRISQLGKGEEDEDEEIEPGQRPPPPQVNSGLSFPKPNLSRNWNDDDAEIRRQQNNQKEFSIPKPALSTSWQAYPGDRKQPKRNQGNDFRHDDNMSNYSYDGNGKNTGGGYRNPLSGNNDSDRHSRPPGFKLPSVSGNDNFGYKRDVQRNNNYY